MKSHIGPNGPGRCTATIQSCPFGGAENHFDTIVEARTEYETRLSKAYDEVATVKTKKLRLTEKEQELRAKNAELAKEIIALRSQAGGITFEDANPERAKRRLDEAVAFAESRGNTHLIEKLSHASVLPSGAFKLTDGSRANVDKYLKAKQSIEQVESARDALLNSINRAIEDGAPNETSFKLSTDAGSFSLTLKPGFDQAEFDKLPTALQNKLKSEKTGLSIEAARENLPPKLLAEVTTDSQVVDFVAGKPTSTEIQDVKPNTTLTGNTPDEKVKSGLSNIAQFYGEVRKSSGTVRDMRAVTSSNNTAIKSATASTKGPVFVPARSQHNGLVVTRRQGLNAASVKAKLTPEQIDSITVARMEPDATLARTILPAESFDKIFGKVTASLRVTEAK